jgi:hypothetical protein
MHKQTTKRYDDLKRKALPQSSMLALFPLLKDENGEYCYNIFRPYILNDDIFADKNMDMTTLMYNEWWENIGYDYYGFAESWWMVALTNGIVNPFEEIDPAQNVYMLKSQYLPLLYRDMQKIRNL